MVKRTGLVLFGLVAVVAVTMFSLMLHASITGKYVTGGGGRYTYEQPQIVQLQPDEACRYSGFEPVYPVRVFSNRYGTLMSTCRDGDAFVAVPVVQTAIVR